MDTQQLVSIMLAATILLAVGGGIWNRIALKKGQGWQYIRFNTVMTALPVVGILALNGILTEASASAIIAGALGYAFGKSEKGGDSDA